MLISVPCMYGRLAHAVMNFKSREISIPLGDPNYGFAIWHEGPLPLVEATFQNKELFLTWPKEFNDAHLESSPSLQNDEWQESDLFKSTVITCSSITRAAFQRFYRLRLN